MEPKEKKPVTPEKVASRIKKADTIVKVEDLVGEIMAGFRGIKEFADAYVKAYKDAPPGSIAKARLLDGVVGLLKWVDKKEKPTIVDEMSDDEINGEIERRLVAVIHKTQTAELAEDLKNGTQEKDGK